MKSFLIISLVLYYTLRFNGRVNGFNSDFAKLENLLTREKAMIESLSEYLVSEEVINSRLRRLTDNSLSLNSIALKDDTEGSLLGHPLDVYLLEMYKSPKIVVIHEFLSESETQTIISLTKPSIEKPFVGKWDAYKDA